MGQRVLTGFIGGVFIAFVTYLGGSLYDFVFLAITCIAIYELSKIFFGNGFDYGAIVNYFFAFALFYVILLFIWAFGKPKARSLKNYAKATLLLTLIVIVLVVVGSLIWGKYIMDYVPEGFENFNFNMDF